MKNMTLKDARQRLAELHSEKTALLAKDEISDADLARVDEISAAWKPLFAHKERLEELAEQERQLQPVRDRNEPVDPERAPAARSQGKQLGEFGRFLQAVFEAGQPGGKVDRDLLFQAAASGASATVPSDGAYLIRKDFSDILLNRALETSQLANLCYRQPIGPDSDGIELPFIDETSRATGSRWGGVQVFRRAEADTVTATRPKIGKQELRLEDMMGLCYVTNRLLKDAPAMEAWINKSFASEFAFKLDDEIIRGKGGGSCLGLLNAPALVTVAKETTQAATGVVFQNIEKMWSRLSPGSLSNSNWFVNQDVLPALWSMDFPVGTGGSPAFMPPGGLSGSPYMSLMGRPVVPVEQCETLGTVGDIILADLSQYMLIDKGELEAASSMHVRFLYDEMAFRFILRINGQPMKRTALTPYKGTATTSPYIALATRA